MGEPFSPFLFYNSEILWVLQIQHLEIICKADMEFFWDEERKQGNLKNLRPAFSPRPQKNPIYYFHIERSWGLRGFPLCGV